MHPVHSLDALLAKPYRILINYVFSMPSMHLLNALLAELLENPSMILFYPMLSSAQSYLQCI